MDEPTSNRNSKHHPPSEHTKPLVFANPCPLSVLRPLNINKVSPITNSMKDPFLFYIDFADQIDSVNSTHKRSSLKQHETQTQNTISQMTSDNQTIQNKENKENVAENLDAQILNIEKKDVLNQNLKGDFDGGSNFMNNRHFGHHKSRADHLAELLRKEKVCENLVKNGMTMTNTNWNQRKFNQKGHNQSHSNHSAKQISRKSQNLKKNSFQPQNFHKILKNRKSKLNSMNMGGFAIAKANQSFQKNAKVVKSSGRESKFQNILKNDKKAYLTLKETLQGAEGYTTKGNFYAAALDTRKPKKKLRTRNSTTQRDIEPRLSVRDLTKRIQNHKQKQNKSSRVPGPKTRRAKASIPRIKRPSFRRSQPRTIKPPATAHEIQLVSLRRLSVKAKNSQNRNLFKAIWKKNTRETFSKTFHRARKKRPQSGQTSKIQNPTSLGGRFNTEAGGPAKPLTDKTADWAQMTGYGGFKIAFNTEPDNPKQRNGCDQNDTEAQKDPLSYFDNEVWEAGALKPSGEDLNVKGVKESDFQNLEEDLCSQNEENDNKNQENEEPDRIKKIEKVEDLSENVIQEIENEQYAGHINGIIFERTEPNENSTQELEEGLKTNTTQSNLANLKMFKQINTQIKEIETLVKIKEKIRTMAKPDKPLAENPNPAKRLKNMTTIHWQTKTKVKAKNKSKTKPESMPFPKNSKPQSRGTSFQFPNTKRSAKTQKTFSKIKRIGNFANSLKTTLNLTQMFGLSRELAESRSQTHNEISNMANMPQSNIKGHETSLLKQNPEHRRSAISISVNHLMSQENQFSKIDENFENSFSQEMPENHETKLKNSNFFLKNKAKEKIKNDKFDEILKKSEEQSSTAVGNGMKPRGLQQSIDLKHDFHKIVFISKRKRNKKKNQNFKKKSKNSKIINKSQNRKQNKKDLNRILKSKRNAKKILKAVTLGEVSQIPPQPESRKIPHDFQKKKGNFFKKINENEKQKPKKRKFKFNSKENQSEVLKSHPKRLVKTLKQITPNNRQNPANFLKQKSKDLGKNLVKNLKNNIPKPPISYNKSKRKQDSSMNPSNKPANPDHQSSPKSHIIKNIRNIKNLKRPIFAKSKTENLSRRTQTEGPPSVYMKSGDVHLKKFLKKAGVQVRNSIVRTRLLAPPDAMKYVAQDQMKDYRRLRDGQIFNHFEGNEEITDKGGLNRNMNRRQMLSGGQVMFRALTVIQEEKEASSHEEKRFEQNHKDDDELENVQVGLEQNSNNRKIKNSSKSLGNSETQTQDEVSHSDPKFQAGTGQAERNHPLELVTTPSKEHSGTGDNSCLSSYKKLNNFWKTKDFLFSPEASKLMQNNNSKKLLPAFSLDSKAMTANFTKNSDAINSKNQAHIVFQTNPKFSVNAATVEPTQKIEKVKQIKNLEPPKPQTRTQNFYPETYDLSSQDQRDRFIEFFFFQTTFVILKNHVQYFSDKRPQLISKLIPFLKKRHLKSFQVKLEAEPDLDSLYIPVYSSKYVKLSEEKKDKNFVVNVFMIGQLIEIWKMIKQRLTGLEDEQHSFNHRKIDLETRKRFEELSRCPPSYHTLSACERTRLGLSSEYWKTPSSTLMLYLLDFHLLFALLLPHYQHTFPKNLWIVKPGCKSKGVGIFVSNDLGKIRTAWKHNPNRLVQQYVEDPLLLDNRKFDIRVWVLIESLDPLKIWMFEDFYLRFCSKDYDDSKMDLTRHLTNYAINKGRFGGKLESSAMARSQFLGRIDRSHGTPARVQMTQRIEQLIVSTVHQCRAKMRPREASFELLGFDILIRKDLTPVLLEVNLSPACAGRTSYLLRNLDQMTSGLMAILTNKLKYSGNKLTHWLAKVAQQQTLVSLDERTGSETPTPTQDADVHSPNENSESKPGTGACPKPQKWKAEFSANLENLESFYKADVDGRGRKPTAVLTYQSEPNLPNSPLAPNNNCLLSHAEARFPPQVEPLAARERRKSKAEAASAPLVSGWKMVAFQTQLDDPQKIISSKTDLIITGTKLDIRKEMKKEDRIRKNYFARVLQSFFRKISERKWYLRMQQNLSNMGGPRLESHN